MRDWGHAILHCLTFWLLAAACTLGSSASTPAPDAPALIDQQALRHVLQRIPCPPNRLGVADCALVEYLGRGEWLVQYGSEATWLVRERERRAEPLDEWARSLEEQIRSDDQ